MLLSRLLCTYAGTWCVRHTRLAWRSIKLAWKLFCCEKSLTAKASRNRNSRRLVFFFFFFLSRRIHAFRNRYGQAINSLIGHDRVRHKAFVMRFEFLPVIKVRSDNYICSSLISSKSSLLESSCRDVKWTSVAATCWAFRWTTYRVRH